MIIGTNAYAGNFWPACSKTFLPSRTPQLVSQPLRDNVAKSILPGGQIMSDTRHLTVGVRMHDDGRLHHGRRQRHRRGESDALYAPLARHARRLFPQLGELEWQYRWSGFMAMTPDRYPRLFELAPGVGAALGYSGRGICTATILGRELARWAAGESGSTRSRCRPRASARCPTMRCAASSSRSPCAITAPRSRSTGRDFDIEKQSNPMAWDGGPWRPARRSAAAAVAMAGIHGAGGPPRTRASRRGKWSPAPRNCDWERQSPSPSPSRTWNTATSPAQ